MKLNNGLEIPQIGVGTWTLVERQRARNNHLLYFLASSVLLPMTCFT